jgi:hypothetical protein
MCLGKNHIDNIKTKHPSNQLEQQNSKKYILRSFQKIRETFSRIGGKNN